MRYPQSRELVERLMKVYGIDPEEEGAVASLARVTGIDARYLYRWRSGQFRPNADNLLEILERAGVLTWTPDHKIEGTVPRPVTSDDFRASHDRIHDRLDAIEERLRELSVAASRR